MTEHQHTTEGTIALAASWSREAVAALVQQVVGTEVESLPPLGIVLDLEPASPLRIAGSGDGGVADMLERLPDDGYAIISGDDSQASRLAGLTAAHVLRVGRSAGCELLAENIDSQPGHLKFTCDGITFELPVTGRHAVTWALAAIAAGRICCLDQKQIATRLATASLPAGYCEVTQQGEATVVNNTAGGTLNAFRAAGEVLRTLTAKRRVVLCGERSNQEGHAGAARFIGQEVVTRCGADLLIVCGEHRQAIAASARQAGLAESQMVIAASVSIAMEWLTQHTRAGDAVLVDQAAPMAAAELFREAKTTNTTSRAA